LGWSRLCRSLLTMR